MSYKKLDIRERTRDVSIAIHKMTLTELPKFEMYEEGNQIRRSSKIEHNFNQQQESSNKKPK